MVKNRKPTQGFDRSKYVVPPEGRVAVIRVDGVVYRLVPGCRFLFVSEDGEVYSTSPHALAGGKATTHINSSGYLLSSKGKGAHDMNGIAPTIHRLVALAWVQSNGNSSELDVNHKDGNKLNNHASNLEWCSRRDNLYHAMSNGLHANPMKPVVGWNDDNSGWYFRSQSEARYAGFVPANISKVVTRERPRANGFCWENYES